MRRRFLELEEAFLALACTPAWLSISARTLFVLFLAFAAVLMFAPWQQSSSGSGQVVAYAPVDRPQEIHAPVKGRVIKWHVIEGAHVQKGDLLVEMEDVDPNYLKRLEQSQAAIDDNVAAAEERANAYERQEEAYVEARELKVKAATLKVKMVDQKIAALAQGIEAAQAQVTTSSQNLVRRRDLLSRGLVSTREVELAELDVAKAEANLNKAKAKLIEAEAERKLLEAERLRVGSEELGKIASAHAEMRKAKSEVAKAQEERIKIDVALSRQRSSVVRASRSGTVLWVNGNIGGNIVKSGEVLLVLVPDDAEHAVELWVDGNDVPLVHVGRNVRLQFEGWPAVQFAGWPQVAVGTFGGQVAFVDATSRKDGKFRVVVRPDPEDEPWPDNRYLRQGVRTQGWVLLDEVALGFELWRLFNGFPPSIADGPASGPGAKSKRNGDAKDKEAKP